MPEKNIVCALDGKRFATKRALKAHNVAVHARSPSRPKRKSRRGGRPGSGQSGQRRVNSTRNITFTGTDLIGSVNVTDTDKPGKLLLAWDINPALLVNSRLSHLARTFARWRPEELHFSIIPGMGVLTPGSYAAGWVADPSFNLGDTSTRLARISTLAPNILSSFGQPQVLSIPVETSQKWLFCKGSDELETSHGLIVVVLAAYVGGKNLTINFKLDWTISFSSPEVPQSVDSVEIYPDPAYIPIFTDSVSDWANGTKLTFKHAEGGSVVPWLGVRDDMVYKAMDGVKVPYNDGTTSKNCMWFAAIGGIYPTGLACFATEADAKEYVKKKDFAKAITYVSAGAWVTPALPTLSGSEVEAIGLDLRMKTFLAHEQVKALAAGVSSINLSNSRNTPLLGTSFLNDSLPGPSFCTNWRPRAAPSLLVGNMPTTNPTICRTVIREDEESSIEDLGECQ